MQLQNNKSIKNIDRRSKVNFAEKIVTFVENSVDKKAIRSADYKNGTSLEDLEKELGFV